MRMDALEICLASLLGWKADARLQALQVGYDYLNNQPAYSGEHVKITPAVFNFITARVGQKGNM